MGLAYLGQVPSCISTTGLTTPHRHRTSVCPPRLSLALPHVEEGQIIEGGSHTVLEGAPGPAEVQFGDRHRGFLEVLRGLLTNGLRKEAYRVLMVLNYVGISWLLT
jgi:hypothetical protein